MTDIEMVRRKRQAEASAKYRAKHPRPVKTLDARKRITKRPPKLQKMHGMSRSKEYRAWHQMRERCFNPRCGSYADYGGRGITVCQEWTDFERFYMDMGAKPSPRHSLDREDNNGLYAPSNCRWATPSEQAANTRQTKRWEIDGVVYRGLGAAMAALGMKRAALQWRMKSPHWPTYRTVS